MGSLRTLHKQREAPQQDKRKVVARLLGSNDGVNWIEFSPDEYGRYRKINVEFRYIRRVLKVR